MLIFSLDADSNLGSGIAAELGASLAAHEYRCFEDGEHKTRPLADPRGCDTYVVASLHGGPRESPNDKLCRLLLFLATLRDHGARRVTAVIPYLAYARKDRQTKPFDPLSLRYLAQLLEAVGTSQLIVLEAHNLSALQNAFRCPTLHLEGHRLFDPIAVELAPGGPVAVASPDPGGVKRAQLWREALAQTLGREIGFAMADKRRSGGALTSMSLVAGDVVDATVFLLDDLIGTGETVKRAAVALRQAGARRVFVFAAHGLFIGPAADNLAHEAIAGIAVSDSVPPFRLPQTGPVVNKLRIASAVPLLARAISDCHCQWAR